MNKMLGQLTTASYTPRAFKCLFCPILQGLLKKHEAFETDFTVHRDRVNDVCTNGDELIKKVP